MRRVIRLLVVLGTTMTLTELIIIGLACWRLAHLVVHEDAPWRIMARLRARTTLGGLLDCIYCASIWTAALCWLLQQTPLYPVVIIAAISGFAMMARSYTGAGRN